jgi:hypothetical protein
MCRSRHFSSYLNGHSGSSESGVVDAAIKIQGDQKGSFLVDASLII